MSVDAVKASAPANSITEDNIIRLTCGLIDKAGARIVEFWADFLFPQEMLDVSLAPWTMERDELTAPLEPHTPHTLQSPHFTNTVGAPATSATPLNLIPQSTANAVVPPFPTAQYAPLAQHHPQPLNGPESGYLYGPATRPAQPAYQPLQQMPQQYDTPSPGFSYNTGYGTATDPSEGSLIHSAPLSASNGLSASASASASVSGASGFSSSNSSAGSAVSVSYGYGGTIGQPRRRRHKYYTHDPSTPLEPSLGQFPPRNIQPIVTTSVWLDQRTECYQVEVRGVCVARRHDNNFINGTKLLNVTRMTRGRRDGLLKAEKVRQVVKIGTMHLKGVWIPLKERYIWRPGRGL